MAERRMFSKMVVETDSFYDLNFSAQCLYFHLGMLADDDGFVTSPRRAARALGTTDEDFNQLVTNGLIIPFDSGVCAVRHWNANNSIRQDRRRETHHTKEKALLKVEDNVYLPILPDGNAGQPTDNQLSTNCQPTDNQLSTPGIGLGIGLGIGSGINNIYSSSVANPARFGDEKRKAKAKKTKQTFAHDSNPYKAAKYLESMMKENTPGLTDKTEADLQRWADSFDKCHRIDRHPWETIEDVLKWCQADQFWKTNILSGSKFREKFETLLAKATSAGAIMEG